MPDNIEAPIEAEGQSAEAATPDTDKVIEDLRKRQSGADRAREVAIAERDALAAQLEALRSGKAAKDGDGSAPAVDIEAVKRELRQEFEAELAKGVAAERAKALDAQFPAARTRFPEIVDAAKLAELEAMFGDAPKPIGNNQQRSTAPRSLTDMSVKELRESLDSQVAGFLGRE